jgi:hypothetical protein
MASLHWTFLYGVLLFQIAVLLLLIAPQTKWTRKWLNKGLVYSWNLFPWVRAAVGVIFLLTLVLFVQAMVNLDKLGKVSCCFLF